LLETRTRPVDAIASEVGYQDSTFFSRLFRRRTALTPAQYRRRFGALSTQLRNAARRT
jgi:transcriptional regulator GlxA family with amidase domain